MTEFYIGVINRIRGDDRLSFSMILDMPQDLTDDDKEAIGEGITFTPEETCPIVQWWFEQAKEKGYRSSWMEEWTTATIYRLYRGEEQINV